MSAPTLPPNTIVGTDGNDNLLGTGNNDFLYGGAGNDSLNGWYPSDWLSPPDSDTAIYGGVRDDYIVKYFYFGMFSITDTRLGENDGIDFLQEIEYLQFSDGTFYIGPYSANKNPTSPTLSSASVSEYTPVGTVVGTMSATDPEGRELVYHVYDPSGTFAVVGDTLVTTRAIDFEQTRSFDISIAAVDPFGGSASTPVVIFVKDEIDYFSGTSVSDKISGTAGPDEIHGNGGNDRLSGGTGRDVLFGGRGADTLIGGAGADTFAYNSYTESRNVVSQRDTIYDFASGDRILLTDIDANTKVSGNQSFKYIGAKEFSGTAGELRYQKNNSDTYIYADVNGDKKADLAIHLDDAMTLSKGFFFL